MAEIVKVVRLPGKEKLFYLIGSILLIIIGVLKIIAESRDPENSFLWRSSWISSNIQRVI
jgi:hypothetical protein